MNRLTDPVEKLGHEVIGYVDTRVDDLKLQAAKGLSQGSGALAALVLILVMVSALVLVLSFAGVLLLGEVLGSYAKAAFLVAGILLIGVIILLLCRKYLFRDSFVGLFTDIFSPEDAQASPIKSQKQLDAALERSHSRIQKREDAIQARVQRARSYYSPKNLLVTSVRKDVFPLLLRLLGGRKRKK